jgi:prepilin-type N-terminal cleavage/methylation domain-containing protein
MKPKAYANGFSLVELLIVIIILGVAAKAAIPFLSSGDDEKLDVAASEIVQALRFARAEAIRIGTCIEVVIEPDGIQQLSLYPNKVQITQWTGCATAQAGTSSIPLHPIDKKPYLFVMGQIPNTQGVSNRNINLIPSSSQTPYRVFFNPNGEPKTTAFDLNSFSYVYIPLTSGSVELNSGAKKRTITVSAAGKIN